MSWLVKDISETVNRRVCRFLIHRYLGHLLKEKLSLEQLSVDLYNGTGTIHDVNVDAQYVNELLELGHVPLRLVDGYMGEITASVPWADILKDSCVMQVKRLQVTLRPHKAAAKDMQPDTMSSMIESMMGSLASSVDLAKSFLTEDTDHEQQPLSLADEGIEAFAQVIDAVLCRMRLVFLDTIIRLETFDSDTEMGSAVEIQIDRLDFLDEQLEACEQAGTSAEPITSQPHSLYSIPDLNKIVHLTGVRLYTDVFSKPEQSQCASLDISQICTSMYLRRQQGREKSPRPEQSVASEFQSCYSSTLSGSQSSSCSIEQERGLPSDPVQFAQLTGEKQTLRVRLRNSQLSPKPEGKNTKVDILMFLGGMSVFLTPAQLNIVQQIVSDLLLPSTPAQDQSLNSKGKPMRTDDFAKVESQLQNQLIADQLWRTDFTSGNWSGEEHFYETNRKPGPRPEKPQMDGSEAFTSIVMNSEPPSVDNLNANEQKAKQNAQKWDEKPEVTHLKARLSSFWLILTHSDPLRERGVDVLTATARLKHWAEAFFEKSAEISLSARSDLNQLRPVCDQAFDKDHLRFLSCPLVLDYTLEHGTSSDDTIMLQLSAANCQFIEYLCPESSGGSECTYVELLQFEKQPENWAEEPDLKLSFSNRESQQQGYQLCIELAACRTELDMTLVDRIYNLSNRSPISMSKNISGSTSTITQRPYLFDTEPIAESLELRNDLFEPPAISKPAVVNQMIPEQQSKALLLDVDIRCPLWTVDLRVPVADLRDPSTASGRPPWWIRRVQPEIIGLEARNMRVRLPNIDTEKVSVSGCVRLTCQQLTGSLRNLENGDQKFLFANSSEKNKQCSLLLKWDLHNKSLRVDQEGGAEAEQSNGSWGSYFRVSSGGLEGPFSKKVAVHENDELTLVGDKQEMQDFSHGCMTNCDLSFEFDVPELRLCLPDKNFYELLYNRLVNDIALWQPCSPAFHPLTSSTEHLGSASAYYSIHVAGLDASSAQFQLCQSAATCKDSDEESESESASTVTERPNAKAALERTHSSASNRICFCLRSDKCRVLLGTKDNETDAPAQLTLESKNSELFVVSGYHGDPNLVYFYVTLQQCWLWHQNLPSPDSVLWSLDVGSSKFGKPAGLGLGFIQAEPLGETQSFGSLVSGDNFSVALRLELNPKDNVKDILVAVGVRNCLLQMRPFHSTSQLWINQLVEFFDVVDFPIEGYEMPRIVTELHVHGWNSQIGYNHSTINKQFPVQLRLALDSCDVSSRIVQDFSVLRFRCLFEDAQLMAHAGDKEKHVNFSDQSPQHSVVEKQDFVCLMRMGFFDFEVTVNELMLSAAVPLRPSGPLRGPLLEFKANNDLLRLMCCADSLALLLRVVRELVDSDYFKPKSPEPEEEEEKQPVANSELSPAVHEHLQEMVRSAMQHTVTEGVSLPPEPAPLRQEPDIEGTIAAEIDASYENDENRSRHSSTGDEFCIVDQIPGSGITLPSGEPRIQWLSSSPIKIQENHFSAAFSEHRNSLDGLPEGYPQPLIRYFINNISILVQFFGGCDFGESVDLKPYSSASSKKSGLAGVPSHRRDPESRGGQFRDHSVLVECQLSKISFLYELFGLDAPAVSRHWLTIQDVQIRDRIALSKINKILYQYSTGDQPRRTCAPMLSIRQLEINPAEANIKMSLLPLRLNLDQDTLEFLKDFFADVGQASATVGLADKKVAISDPVLQVETEPAVPDSPALCPTQSNAMQDSVATLADFFEEEPNSEICVDGARQSVSVRFSNNHHVAPSPSASAIVPPEEPMDQLEAARNRQTNDQIFIKTFEFSPGVSIRLDYEGKQRLNMDQGAVQGLLVGLSQLHCTELHLKQLKHRQGLLGYGRCAQYAVNEWLNDIRSNQIPRVVGSVGPISSLVQIAQGVKDLFVMPLEEYRKTDGHVVKGIQRGAQSFGVSTAAATIELTQRLVGLVQGMAEFAFDIVTPEYPPPRRQSNALSLLRQPTDFREGVTMAYDTVRVGVNETAEVLQLAAQEERAQGRWPLRGILRQATPTALRPIVLASKATTHLLDGLKSQLKPDTRKEQIDKWRHYR